jgi:deoxyribodipyrimidine photo-lyase
MRWQCFAARNKLQTTLRPRPRNLSTLAPKMPPKARTPFKRKAASASPQPLPTTPSAKRPRTSTTTPDFTDRTLYKDSKIEEDAGIILRKYYPPELTNARASLYATGELERPATTLANALQATASARAEMQPGQAVVFWFKSDLRLHDNRGLASAVAFSKKHQLPLIGLYICSPQDWEAHLTAPIRVDFILRSLAVLKRDLGELDIPLYVEEVAKRREVVGRLLGLCSEWGARHVWCNAEYEVDELRREAGLVKLGVERGVSVEVVHDSCVVNPGEVRTAAGGVPAVYSPWFRKWVAHLNANPGGMEEAESVPGRNPEGTSERFRELFEKEIPNAPARKRLEEGERERLANMWPAGEHEAVDRLRKFVKERIGNYAETRNLPAGNGTSTLSAHLAAGTIAARTCVRMALEASPGKKKEVKDDRSKGHSMWIAEVAWRDFYKHVLVNWPYVCMNKPFKPEYSNIEWEYDGEMFSKWTEGRTGFPIVDAAMRQARQSG